VFLAMIFSLQSAWDIVYCMGFLLFLYTCVRFVSTSLSDFLIKTMPEQASSKVDPYHNDVKYAVSYWTERGGRPYKEDRHEEVAGVGAEDSSLYAVYDGHGGEKAAQYCKEHLLKSVKEDPDFVGDPARALDRAFFK
jgi:hypothetical protein